MKIIKQLLVVLGALALVPGITAQDESKPLIKHRELTIWITSPIGSHIGSGYASTYLTNIPARTIAKDDPKLQNAIRSLDSLGMVSVQGFGLLPAAVAWQTEKPMRAVILQQAQTGLSYGELLMANSLASQSNQSFGHIIAMRAKAQTWGEVAEQLQVDPEFVVDRANIAAQRIVAVDFRSRHRQSRGNTSVTSINPHGETARLH